MDQVPITLRVDEDIHETLRNVAFEERRSMNNLINYILRKWMEENIPNSKNKKEANNNK